ncbi:hypothetical protein G3446_00635 [Thiorhodococcus minor]|uniref:Primosomal replication protein PriB/PriC domain protein n=2 Tax=Thiorhodococcus minor TaxID=57489 RepID=A0A6M0JSB6_9GAMM|nr:hypothetical protein [Thiorhodococcus minor]
MRDLYLAAEQDLLQHGKSSAFEGRTLTMADLTEIRAGRQEWERRVMAELASTAHTRGGLSVSVASFGNG